MAHGGPRDGQRGSILLPVILLLLLLATAATAMTLQARTSLREAAMRRDRLALSTVADGAVRGTALVLAAASAARSAPAVGMDGTPQFCRLDRNRRLWLTVQDEGGLVDLNKGTADLISEILRRADLSAPEAGRLSAVIMAHRADAPRPRGPAPWAGRKKPETGAIPEARDFALADELGDLPGVDTRLFLQLRPLFTTANRSTGIDPTVAAPAIRALIPAKELTSPQFEAKTTPSNHSDFTITATVMAPSGQAYARRALFRIDPEAGPAGRFTAWDALPLAAIPLDAATGPFCNRIAGALSTQ